MTQFRDEGFIDINLRPRKRKREPDFEIALSLTNPRSKARSSRASRRAERRKRDGFDLSNGGNNPDDFTLRVGSFELEHTPRTQGTIKAIGQRGGILRRRTDRLRIDTTDDNIRKCFDDKDVTSFESISLDINRGATAFLEAIDLADRDIRAPDIKTFIEMSLLNLDIASKTLGFGNGGPTKERIDIVMRKVSNVVDLRDEKTFVDIMTDLNTIEEDLRKKMISKFTDCLIG